MFSENKYMLFYDRLQRFQAKNSTFFRIDECFCARRIYISCSAEMPGKAYMQKQDAPTGHPASCIEAAAG